MQLLHNVAKFSTERNDLKSIYMSYIRPILEQSAAVWHSSLSKENIRDLERVKKSAIRIIMGKNHLNYETSLEKLGLKHYKKEEFICV